MTCNASKAPTNGSVGNCNSRLPAGKSCQPKCNTGYKVSGSTTCSTSGTLKTAACVRNI